jgi:hypothetical protein
VPYATLASEKGNPPNVVTTPDGVLGLYDKGYAARAARYLNQMAEASNKCQQKAWFDASKAFTQLINAAEANYNRAQEHYRAVYAEAVNYWAHSNTAGNRLLYGLTLGAYDPVTQLPEPLRSRLSRAKAAEAIALSDWNALRSFKLPQYRCRQDYAQDYTPHYLVLIGSDLLGSDVTTFVGFNVGGGFQNTNFTVDPPFNVNGSGVIGGGFGGVLLPVPNTSVLMGPRFGIQGSNITGSITSPAASPAFTYNVRTNWMAYEEGLAEIPIEYVPSFGGGFTASITLSAGVAESGVSVKGTSGMFSVTDNAVRTGTTFTAGFEVPVGLLPGATGVYLFSQYRGTQWIGTVNIPGAVNIGSFTNEVDVGFNFRFVDLTERFPR